MKTGRAKLVYAVRRLWKGANDIHFTTKPILSGAYKAKILFTMTIPRGTEYAEQFSMLSTSTSHGSTEIITHVFTFGGVQFPVQVKG